MSASKVVLPVLILIAVLFAVGVGLGVGRGNEGADPKENWPVKALSWLNMKEPLKLAEIKTREGQLQGRVFTLRQGVPCHAEITASDASVRTTTLKLIEGRKVEVLFVPSGRDAGSRMTLETGKTEECELVIREKGGTLTLTWKASDVQPIPHCKVALAE